MRKVEPELPQSRGRAGAFQASGSAAVDRDLASVATNLDPEGHEAGQGRGAVAAEEKL